MHWSERPAGFASAAGIVFLLAAAPAGVLEGEGERPAVETVWYNGTVHTMNPTSPSAEAFAVGGGRVLAVGSSRELLERFPRAERHDLGGRAVLPGLTDAHAHFKGYALQRARLDLTGTASLEEVLARITERARVEGPGKWILGRGWDQNDWPVPVYPSHEAIDRAAPANPVFVSRVCGHAAYVNSVALAVAGVGRNTPDPPGGRILRDERGEPTGILIDEAMELVRSVVPPLSSEETKRLLAEAARDCLAAGLVGVHDMGITPETAALYRELYEADSLPFRITAYWEGSDPRLAELLAGGPIPTLYEARFSVPGVKLYADGSLGARSAALLEDYTDEPGNRGILATDPDTLCEHILVCQRHGFQVAVHAIGDRANRIALDCFERALASAPAAGIRHRIEHAQVISADDLPRFGRLGVIPSMQFTHCTSDMPWVAKRLGAERLAGAYAWRSLLHAGCRIPGGSDFPVERIDPLLGIYAAVTRQDLGGNPTGGWNPAERLTVEEAVRAFTVDAAWAAGRGETEGALAPGMLADFIVLSEDPFAVPPSRIPTIDVLATILGGKIVHLSPVGKALGF